MSPVSVTANGTSSATITMQLRNQSGGTVGIGGTAVTVASSLGALSTVTDHGNGTYTATLSSSTLGSAVVSAKLGAVPIASIASVTFVPGPAARLAIVPVTDLVANRQSSSTATVRVEDATGHLVSDSTVTLRVSSTAAAGFAKSDGSFDIATTGQARMASGGLATFALRGGASSGDTTLTATAAGLTTATTTVTTAAQTISSALLTADPAVLAADNSSQSQLRVTLLDQAGHPYLGAATDGWTAEFSSSDTGVLTVPTAAIAAVADAANGAHVDTLATVHNNVGAAQVAAVIKQGPATRFTGSLSVSSALVGSP